jgi:hypothetical protein
MFMLALVLPSIQTITLLTVSLFNWIAGDASAAKKKKKKVSQYFCIVGFTIDVSSIRLHAHHHQQSSSTTITTSLTEKEEEEKGSQRIIHKQSSQRNPHQQSPRSFPQRR